MILPQTKIAKSVATPVLLLGGLGLVGLFLWKGLPMIIGDNGGDNGDGGNGDGGDGGNGIIQAAKSLEVEYGL
ncbi:MAG: hypothetical protein Q7N50_08040 [Armatimonadota bacterium]|nr:hypothetical protein [Armatimonadota bacterium]